jgi:hypothetical protein
MTEARKVSEDVVRQARELEGRFFIAGVEAAQRELVEFLRAHRSELGSDPYWQAYIEDLDRGGLLEPPGSADPAAQRLTERAVWSQGSSADAPVAPPANRAAPGRRP